MTEQANPQPGADLQSAVQRLEKMDAPAETEEAQEATPETEAETQQEDTESQSTETQQEDQEASSEPQEAEAEEEQIQFESLDQFADALEMPMDDFMGNIKTTVKINGAEKTVTLSELRDGYQMEADYRRKTSELAEQRKEFEAEREQSTNELSKQFTEAEQLTGLLEQSLLNDYNSVDWNGLRQSDPAEFAAKKQEFNDKYAQIQQVRTQVNDEIRKQYESQQEERQEKLEKILNQEWEKLIEAIPDFGNEEKAKVLVGNVQKYLNGFGFTDDEIKQIYDHRHMLIIRDAMAYRDLKTRQPEVKNKVVNAPKLQKPGGGQKPGEEKVRQQLRAKLRKSGRVEDAAALIKL